MKKVFFIATFFSILFFYTNAAYAQSAPTIHVSHETGEVGDVVNVTFSLENNPGIISLKLEVAYDDTKLEIVGVNDAGKLGPTLHLDLEELDLCPYKLSWFELFPPDDYTFNGVIATLEFKILDVVENSPITITPSSVRNKADVVVNFDVDNGSVTGTLYDPTQDNADIAAAKLAIESATYSVPMTTLNDASAAKTYVQDLIDAMNLGVNATVVDVVDGFSAAVAGTVGNLTGTAGSYLFTVSLSKGKGTQQITDELILTIIATAYDATQDNADITAAKTAIESATYSVPMTTLNDASAAKTYVQGLIDAMNLGVTATVVDVVDGFSAAVAGTVGNLSGTDGWYTFTVTLNKGAGTQQITDEQLLTIIATQFTRKPGDIDGNGVITAADLLAVQDHILGITLLTGDALIAADVNNDGRITAADLLMMQDHLLGITKLW